MNSKYPSTTKVLCATSIASLVAASSASATVKSYTFSSGNTVESVWLHIDLDGGTISYDANANSDFMLCRKSTGYNGLAIGYKTKFRNSFKEELSGGKLLALPMSAVVSAGKSFGKNIAVFFATSGNVDSHAVGFATGINYIGFSFKNSSGTTCYGWLEINITSSNLVTLLGWAYEDTGAAITAGAVPEPAEAAVGLGALALGAAGLRRWRKGKAAKAA